MTDAVMGRPLKDIDPQKVQALASIWCTNEEIAQIMECSADTIERRFAGALEKGRATGRMSLRRKQWDVAQNGNVTMLIWLGKQYLGQKDQLQLEAIAKDGAGLTATEEYDYSQLSVEELQTLERLMGRAVRRIGTGESNGNGHTNGNGATGHGLPLEDEVKPPQGGNGSAGE